MGGMLLFSAGCAHRLDWGTDPVRAQAAANASGKAVLLDFTGSDWCYFCIKMNQDVINTSTFRAYAKTNLELVEIDFPEKKPQPDALKKQNEAVQAKYKVEGYPTYILVDKSGRELWRQEGYLKGGPEAFIAALEKARQKR